MFDEPIILLPGDEFILDCWTDSSEREYATTGGESSSQEMCFAFLLHYPALDLRYATAAKSSFALETWMKDAQEAGYMNGTAFDIEAIFDAEDDEPDFSTLSYDGSMNGALEFYNRLYSVEYEEYNQHTLFCAGNEGLYNDNTENVVRDESFEEYDLGIDECENSINIDYDNIGICVPSEISIKPTSAISTTEISTISSLYPSNTTIESTSNSVNIIGNPNRSGMRTFLSASGILIILLISLIIT